LIVVTLDQLRIFVDVAERGNMTLASEALGMSQSGASAAIKSLEREYGVHLFNRVGRGIELSQAGARFLTEAKAVLERAASARLVLENISQTIAGTVSVAASLTIASYWLPHRLAAFHEEVPAVRLNVSAGNTRQVEAAVLDGIANIGFVEGRTRSRMLKRTRVDTDRLVFVMGRDAPPPSKDARGNLDLRSVRWIVREKGSGTREVLEDLAAHQGLTFDDLPVFLVLPSNEGIRQVVEAGAGGTIISDRVVARSLAEGKLLQIPLTIPQREFAAITHADRDPGAALLAFKEHVPRAARPASRK
jgi:DNA-binding transcriptional LysR family regulator